MERRGIFRLSCGAGIWLGVYHMRQSYPSALIPSGKSGGTESMKRSFSPDDLPMVDGRVYHLDLAPEELAQNVVVVGDPDPVL